MTKNKFIRSIGRRKTATANVFFSPEGDGTFLVNKKKFEQYFSTARDQKNILGPLEHWKDWNKGALTAFLQGGGKGAQAEALRLALARLIITLSPDLKKTLKQSGWLTRDPRMKERKKPGLKRARRAPQWSKR